MSKQYKSISKTVLGFTITLKFPISSSNDEWLRFEKNCNKRKIKPLLYLKRKLFSELKVDCAQKIPYCDDEILKCYLDFQKSIVKSLAPKQNKFSNWVRIHINNFNKEMEQEEIKNEKNKVHNIAEEQRKNEKRK